MLFAAATLAPDYSIRLLLFGNVPIKYIALIVLILDLLFASQNSNSGGHFAHIGGSFWGWAYISLLRNGIQMNFFKTDNRVKFRPKNIVSSNSKILKPPKKIEEHDSQKVLDTILEKIKLSGFEKLTVEEKQFLERMSKQ